MADDDASIQILDPDVDQQYVPERRERSQKPKPLNRNPDSNWQKPPVIIVERQMVPANTPAQPPAIVADPILDQPTVAAVEEPARIVNIVDERRNTTTDWLKTKASDVAWIAIKFFVMAIFSFIILVALNPPFVQEKGATLDGFNNLQRQSASLSRAAGWAAGAGVLFIVLPPIWDILQSRFFPNDLMRAIGIK